MTRSRLAINIKEKAGQTLAADNLLGVCVRLYGQLDWYERRVALNLADLHKTGHSPPNLSAAAGASQHESRCHYILCGNWVEKPQQRNASKNFALAVTKFCAK